MQSFEAVIMNLGYLGQHTSSMKKTLWVLFNSTSRASFRPKKVLENARGILSPGIKNFEAVNMNLGYFVQHTGCIKNIIGTF